MENKTITISTDKVKSTNAFKKLSKVQQIIISKRVNVKHIENGVNVAINIGFEQWDKQSQFNFNNKAIVKELLFNKLHKIKIDNSDIISGKTVIIKNEDLKLINEIEKNENNSN